MAIHAINTQRALTADDVAAIAYTLRVHNVPGDAPCEISKDAQGWHVVVVLSPVEPELVISEEDDL